MRYDVHPPLGHPEVAGWVLGALDGAEAAAFGEHLWSCAQCQAATAEFEAVAKALDRPVPADEPPPGLEARVLAAVQQAAVQPAAAVQPTAVQQAAMTTQKKIQQRWRPNNRLLLAAAAVIAAGATFVGLEVVRGAAPAVAATIPLSAQAGAAGSGTATASRAQGGFSIQLTVHNLKKLAAGQFYECWYVGPADRPAHRQLITAGTFIVDRDGSETFTMWSAADPSRYPIMEITAESPGNAGQPGQVILSGNVRTG
jgi:hypothetical protein